MSNRTPSDMERGLPSAVFARHLFLHMFGELRELALEALLRNADGVLIAAEQPLRDFLRHRRLDVRRQRDDVWVGHELDQHRLPGCQGAIPGGPDVVRVLDLDALET